MSSSGRLAVVVAGGPGPLVLREPLPADAFVVAADSGLERALSLGLHVDVVIGDFDSVAPSALDGAAAAGARVDRHPREKDATDLELALSVAVSAEVGADQVLVLAGDAGRFDHTLGNVLLLASDQFASVPVTAMIGSARVAVVRSSAELRGEVGELVSLLAVGGVARGIVTEGLRYPLRGEELEPGTSRGVSNEFAVARASVALESGVLLAVQPG